MKTNFAIAHWTPFYANTIFNGLLELLSTLWVTITAISLPKALAQAKPSHSQAKAGAYSLAWGIGKPKPPQAKPSQNNTSHGGMAMAMLCPDKK
jgi:hypothetical protein